MCQDYDSGHRLVDFAFNHGNLKGTNWSSEDDGAERFCRGSQKRLHVADFDGDGGDDLLCHDRRLGAVWIDLSDSAESWRDGAGLRRADASYDLAFCNADNAELWVGAFGPGDARADLLCHNRVTGHKAVLFAKAGGAFEVPSGY